MRVHLVDGTYELFRYHFAMPSHVTDDGSGGRRHPGGGRDRAAARRAGSDARRRGHRPRHRVVPQRPLGRLQVERGHAARAALRSSPLARGRAHGRRLHGVPDGRVRGRRRTRRGGRDRRGRRAGRAGAHLHPGQGPRPVRRRRPRSCSSTGARRPIYDEAGGHREVRRRPRRRSPTTSAVVGDSADGFPGLTGWGAKSAAAVLARYGQARGHPRGSRASGTSPCGAAPSSPPPSSDEFDLALLFRRIATIELDAPTIDERRRAGVDGPDRRLRRDLRAHRRPQPRRPRRAGGPQARPLTRAPTAHRPPPTGRLSTVAVDRHPPGSHRRCGGRRPVGRWSTVVVVHDPSGGHRAWRWVIARRAAVNRSGGPRPVGQFQPSPWVTDRRAAVDTGAPMS